MPESDKDLSENTKQNLDQKLDHAIYETFPTSDPVSVQVTKGGAIDYDEDTKGSPAAGNTGEGLMSQARETLSSMTGSAAEAASRAYEYGRRYVREAAERYPQAGRTYEQGRRMVREYAPENPMVTLVLGAAIGYGIAWMMHHKGWREDPHVPDYARTRRRYRS